SQLDSGSGLTVISEKIFYELFNKNSILRKVFKSVNGYPGEEINVLGFFLAEMVFNGKTCESFSIFVVEKGGPNLLGRDFMDKFNIKLTNINMLDHTEPKLEQLNIKYSNLFSDGMGRYVHKKFKIRLKDNATPIFHKPRQIPFAFKGQVEEKLYRLEKLGVISQVESSKWGSPLVPILKSDGRIRICADYKVTINKFVQEVKYPLPRIEEIFQKVSKEKQFSKIDL
ncbi:Aspartic peptidase domain, partial [Cinara cedri]